MAKFWKHLAHHEDKVQKRPITPEEIRFLTDLQKEMNTQDTCETANPRYWVIRDYKQVYGVDEWDDIVIYDSGSMEKVYEGAFEMGSILPALSGYAEHPLSTEDADSICDLDDLQEWLDEQEFGDSLSVNSYRDVETYSHMFLTEKAAAEHLKANAHHYSENATTYCMCNWRSPEVETLWKILQEVDWGSMLQFLISKHLI